MLEERTHKADDSKDTEYQENDSTRVVTACKHVDSCHETEDDVEDAGDPDELFGED